MFGRSAKVHVLRLSKAHRKVVKPGSRFVEENYPTDCVRYLPLARSAVAELLMPAVYKERPTAINREHLYQQVNRVERFNVDLERGN